MEVSLLSCPVCLKPHFQGVDALRSSLISVATTHIACPVCNDIFLGLDKLTIHLFSHIPSSTVTEDSSSENNKPENVNVDAKSFLKTVTFNKVQGTNTDKSEIDLTSVEEEIMETDTQKSRITCDICNFHFSDENILDLHQKLLHQTSPDRKTGKYSYHCHLCSKQFRMRGSLMVHLRVAHFGFIQSNRSTSNHKSVCMDTNDENQDTESSGLSHIIHEEFDQNHQVIDEQTQIFAVASELPNIQLEKRKISNISFKIQDNKQWECEVCSKLFTTKYFLKKHKRLHTGEMPYYCSQCNKYFTFQQSYHKHMLYHSDDKPHICSECGRAFKELSTLHNHERIHSGERPFACETCGKCFRQRVSYLVHRRIHTGAMPYKCTACNKSFRYKVSQRSHKCPISPPGYVVRTPDLVEKLIQNQKVNNAGLSDDSSPGTQNLHQILNFCKTDLNSGTHNADSSAKHVINIANTREHFDFLDQNLHLNVEDETNIQDDMNIDRNYVQENELLLDTQQNELNKNIPLVVGENSVITISLDTSKRTEPEKECINFNHNNVENLKDCATNSFSTSNDSGNPDFFALILSPVLSEVQSLCLSNYTNAESGPKKESVISNGNEETLQTINEESFKELLYGPTCK